MTVPCNIMNIFRQIIFIFQFCFLFLLHEFGWAHELISHKQPPTSKLTSWLFSMWTKILLNYQSLGMWGLFYFILFYAFNFVELLTRSTFKVRNLEASKGLQLLKLNLRCSYRNDSSDVPIIDLISFAITYILSSV